jgi:prenyltransferase beta subunit
MTPFACRTVVRVSLGIALATTTAAPLTLPAPAHAQDPAAATAPTAVRGDEITPAQQAAVKNGLNWLATRQGKDGGFTAAGGESAAVTSLAALAFMQAGNLPGRGQYGANVERCLAYVLGHCQESGLIAAPGTGRPMYGHGFATLFLAEVYGMTGDDRVKEKLQRAIRLIQRTQNREGGWRYQPIPFDADISVTICQVMALRAARDAGIKVEKDVIDNAIKYVRACQNPDGGFNYMLSRGGHDSAFARSAAGVAALYYAGIYEGDEIARGLAYLKPFTPARGSGDAGAERHYFYGQYYCVQAMFLAGGEHWATFYPAIRDQLIARQGKNGNWSGDFTEDYATSMALIILQMPNRYLPVYTGKGPGS